MEIDSNPLQVVVAIVRDSITGNLLFQERQKVPYKGHFGLVGGKVDEGEERDEAIVREIKEETNLDVQHLTYLQVVHETLMTNAKNHQVALHVYLADVNGQVQANVAEGQIYWLEEKHFNTNKALYISTDWLIVNAVINNEKLFSRISVEDNGNKYAIKAIS